MKNAKWWLPLMSIAMTCAVAAFAVEKPPATQPSDDDSKPAATEKPRASKGGRWGFAPYNKLSGMTDEQKMKISDIHRKATTEIRAIKDKEEADVMAVLTDEQKTELDKMQAETKAKAADKRASAKGKAKDKDADDDDTKEEKDK